MSRNRTPYAPLENSPAGVQPHIYVHGFCFCFRHGEEYCNPCMYDFRYLNSMTIQDDLDKIISEDRRSINVYSKGAVPTYDDEYSWKCTTHDKIDCEECFNWVADVTKEMQAQIKTDKWLEKRQKYHAKRDD